MDDATYCFVTDVAEKKRTGRGVFNRVRGGRVVFPNDNLTAKERKEMNGKLSIYTMDKPHTYYELLAFPKDVRKEYVQGIIEKYQPSIHDFARMLKVESKVARDLLTSLGITRERAYRNPTQKFEWRVFMGENITPPDPTEVAEDMSVVEENPPKTSPLQMFPPIGKIDHLSLHVTGKPMAVASGLPLMLDTNKTYYFTINITEVEEKKIESDPCAAAEGA